MGQGCSGWLASDSCHGVPEIHELSCPRIQELKEPGSPHGASGSVGALVHTRVTFSLWTQDWGFADPSCSGDSWSQQEEAALLGGEGFVLVSELHIGLSFLVHVVRSDKAWMHCAPSAPAWLCFSPSPEALEIILLSVSLTKYLRFIFGSRFLNAVGMSPLSTRLLVRPVLSAQGRMCHGREDTVN